MRKQTKEQISLVIFNGERKSLEALVIQEVIDSRQPVAFLLKCLGFYVLQDFSSFGNQFVSRPWYNNNYFVFGVMI